MAYKRSFGGHSRGQRSGGAESSGADVDFKQSRDTMSRPDVVSERLGIEREGYPAVIGPGTGRPYYFIDSAPYPDDAKIRPELVTPGPDGESTLYALRGYMVFTMPASVYNPNASSWGDVLLQNGAATNTGVLHSLAYFLQAVHDAKVHDACTISAFVELVVQTPGRLPVCSGLDTHRSIRANPMTTPQGPYQEDLRKSIVMRDNMAGIRFWVLLGTDSYGPETIMRRCLFRIQAAQRMFDNCPDVLTMKLEFSYLRDPVVRAAAIKRYCEHRAADMVLAENAREKKQIVAAGMGGAPVARPAIPDRAAVHPPDGGGPAAAAAAAGAAPVPLALGIVDAARGLDPVAFERYLKMAEAYVHQHTVRPMDHQASVHYNNLMAKTVSGMHLTVSTMRQYVEQVIMPVQMMMRVMRPDEAGLLAGSFHDDGSESMCVDEMGGTMFSAKHLFSLESSLVILYGQEKPVHQGSFEAVQFENTPNQVQAAVENYGLHRGYFEVPFRHLTWKLKVPQLKPGDFMRTVWPWHTEQFGLALRELYTEAAANTMAEGAHLRATKTEADVCGTPLSDFIGEASVLPRIARLPKPAAFLSQPPNIEALRLGCITGARRPTAALAIEAMKASLSPADRALLNPTAARSVEKINLLDACRVEADTLNMPANARRGIEEVVRNAITPVTDQYREMWRLALVCAKNVTTIPGWDDASPADLEAYRHARLCELQSLLSSDLFNKLMDVFGKSPDSTASQKAMRDLLCDIGSVSHEPNFCPARKLSMFANFWVNEMLHINRTVGMQAGSVHFVNMSLARMQTIKDQRIAALHSLIIGAPATGKGYLYEMSRLMAMKRIQMPEDHVSAKANHTRSVTGGALLTCEEAPGIVVEHSLEMDRGPNRDLSAKLKMELTSDSIHVQRCVTDPVTNIQQTHQFEKPHVVNKHWTANGFKIGRGAVDMAKLTRWCTWILMPRVDGDILPTDRINRPDREEMRAEFAEMCRSWEQREGVEVLTILSAHTGLIRDMNIELLTIGQSCSLASIMRWYPSLQEETRSNQRQLERGALLIAKTAFYQVFRSEASLLLRFSNDFTNILRSREVHIGNVPAMMGPYMYASHEHALHMITNMLETNYSFDMYLVIRIIASRVACFSRNQMRAIYEDRHYDTIQTVVDRRNAERGSPPLPMFIEDLLQFERRLDNEIRKRPVGNLRADALLGPVFASIRSEHDILYGDLMSGGSGGGVANNAGARSSSAHASSAAGGGPAPAAPKMAGYDPNWVATGMTLSQLTKSSYEYIKGTFTTSEPIIMSILQWLMTKKLSGPVFQRANNYSGQEYPLDQCPQFETKTVDGGLAKMVIQEAAIVRIVGQHPHEEVQISTHALMCPPPYLLFMMLTSIENKHTRERTTVLPLEVPALAAKLYPFEIKRRPETTLSYSNVVAPVAIDLLAVEYGFGIQATPGMAPKGSKTQLAYNEDPEHCAFRKHMTALHAMPPYSEMLYMIKSSASARHLVGEHDLELGAHGHPTGRQYRFMLDFWVKHHPAAPGAGEERMQAIHERCKKLPNSMFGNFAALSVGNAEYPHTAISETKVRVSVMRLVGSGESLFMAKDRSDMPSLAYSRYKLAKRFFRTLALRMTLSREENGWRELMRERQDLLDKCELEMHTCAALKDDAYDDERARQRGWYVRERKTYLTDYIVKESANTFSELNQCLIYALERYFAYKDYLHALEYVMLGTDMAPDMVAQVESSRSPKDRHDICDHQRVIVYEAKLHTRQGDANPDDSDLLLKLSELRDGTFRKLRAEMFDAVRLECITNVAAYNQHNALYERSKAKKGQNGKPVSAAH